MKLLRHTVIILRLNYFRPNFKRMASSSATAVDRSEHDSTRPVSNKRLAKFNQVVNGMSEYQLQEELKKQKLPTSGHPDIQRTRLKNHFKAQWTYVCENPLQMIEQEFRYIAVVDFEATCEQNRSDFPNEIIEFPVVLIDTYKQSIIDQFRSYCRPTINPILSKFCTQLTGIEQHQVETAPLFPEVLQSVEAWLNQRQLLPNSNKRLLAFATDGPWDFANFLRRQCEFSNIPYPAWARQWINIRKAFSCFYSTRRCGVVNMLGQLGLRFDGRCHSGLDDSTNIARIAIAMLKDGCVLTLNDGLHEDNSNVRSTKTDELDDQIVFKSND